MAERQLSTLARVARGVLLLRLAASALSVPMLFRGPAAEGWAFLALLGVLAGSLLPLLAWDRVERFVVRHPVFLALDLLLALAFLRAAGIAAPFVIATLGTATLGGLLYGVPGALLCALVLSVGYAASAALMLSMGTVASAATAPVIVALYPLLAAAGVALRRLLAHLEAARRDAAAAAATLTAAEERSRLARDLHDSVGKSLHGIALMAHALRAGAPDEATAVSAATIEDGARRAALEARAIIAGLRTECAGSLAEAVRTTASTWATAHEVKVRVEADPHADGSLRVRGELLAVLGEALENVARHAGASSVHVVLGSAAGDLLLEVRDDGQGMPDGALDEARRGGHWGVVGMDERARLCGGELEVEGKPGEGTTLRLRMPSGTSSARGHGSEPAPADPARADLADAQDAPGQLAAGAGAAS